MCLVRNPGTKTTGKFTQLKLLWVRERRNRKRKGEGSDRGRGVGRDGGENSSRKRRCERATGIADFLQM